MKVHPTACAHGQPAGDLDIVLHKYARDREGVRELRDVRRLVRIAFECDPGNKRVSAEGRAKRRLSKSSFVTVPFPNFSKLVVVTLLHKGHSGAQHVPSAERHLTNGSSVSTPRPQRFDIRCAGCCQYRTGDRSAGTVLGGEPRSGEERSAVAPIPEQARADETAGVAREIGPGVVIYIRCVLPMSAAEKRERPSLRDRRGIPGDSIRRAPRRAVQQKLSLFFLHGPAGDQIDDAAHGSCAIHGRGDSLDHFHLAEVHRRNLQKTQPADLTEQR